MELCTAGSLDMKFILDLYQRSFPEAERKPFSIIERKAAMGSVEILLVKEGSRRAGFAITALSSDAVLLDYFAIAEEFRGQGIGTDAFLLLKELYSDKCFFLEIEETDGAQKETGGAREETDETQENTGGAQEKSADRLRRKAFYLRNGMSETGIHIELFGVPFEVLASDPDVDYELCRQLYRELLGPAYGNMVRRIR